MGFSSCSHFNVDFVGIFNKIAWPYIDSDNFVLIKEGW